MEGSRPEWYISSMLHSRDITFWSGTLKMEVSLPAEEKASPISFSYTTKCGWKPIPRERKTSCDWQPCCEMTWPHHCHTPSEVSTEHNYPCQHRREHQDHHCHTPSEVSTEQNYPCQQRREHQDLHSLREPWMTSVSGRWAGVSGCVEEGQDMRFSSAAPCDVHESNHPHKLIFLRQNIYSDKQMHQSFNIIFNEILPNKLSITGNKRAITEETGPNCSLNQNRLPVPNIHTDCRH